MASYLSEPNLGLPKNARPWQAHYERDYPVAADRPSYPIWLARKRAEWVDVLGLPKGADAGAFGWTLGDFQQWLLGGGPSVPRK